MVSDSQNPGPIHFSLNDLCEQAEGFWQRWPGARADDLGQRFVSPDEAGQLHLPLAGPRAAPMEQIGDYAERLSESGGEGDDCQLVLLLRAGAMAFGCWRGGELLQHKAVRKYVVRGSGKAQSTHLKTRGKSRYGSRLRLQNWRRLLAETNERVRDCEHEFGPFKRIFYSVPIRVFSELFEADPKPVFARDARELQRLPFHVHRPDYEELLRVRRMLLTGRVDLPPIVGG